MKNHARMIRLALLLFISLMAAPGQAVQRGGSPVGSIEVEPAALVLPVGASATLSATFRNAEGEVVRAPLVFSSSSRRSVGVDSSTGLVEAYAPGEFTVTVVVPGARGRAVTRTDVPVRVLDPPLERIELEGVSERLYLGTVVQGTVKVYDRSGAARSTEGLTFATSDASVVEIDRFANVRPVGVGAATLRISGPEIDVQFPVRVEANPAASIEISPSQEMARTGDVIHFDAVVRDSSRAPVTGLPLVYSIRAHPDSEDPGAPAAGVIAPDGRFVAERPGRYTILVNAGSVVAASTVEVVPRDVRKRVEVVGRAPVRDRHSADLWVWESSGGGDYALTGTWRSDGTAYIWNVTDPAEIRPLGAIRLDARTVNDVKVSEDGRLAVLSREGASNRRNGIVILDVSNPESVKTLAEFDDGLTGGVHNTFIHRNHVYAVNNGRSYDVINVGEPQSPFRVARFELDTPAHAVHDVWVEDGIAYSSNWEDGVVLVDVGNGIAGGSPGNPVEFAAYKDRGGNTHAAFPFRSASTGRFYVVMGDELFPAGLDPQGPTVTAGYMHIVDFTNFDHPVEVARYEVPEAGSHNIWVEDDVLYAAFYNGGLRVVDLSGELMGDLYRQGREIARFLPNDAEGFVPNESMVWGAQPHKGIIYLSDWNSGLWAIRLTDQE